MFFGNVNFYKNIRGLHKVNHITQNEMVQIMEIEIRNLKSIENDVIPVRASEEAIVGLSDYFGLVLSQLFIDMTPQIKQEPD